LSAALLGVLACAPAWAQSVAADPFERGKSAFERGDYEAALRAFRAAATAGMAGVALDYNLGVTYYRLGRYAQARAAFLRVADDARMAHVAQYNLGLIALRLDDREEARARFERARDGTADDALRALATRQLARIAPPPPRGWFSVGAGIGHDSNVRNPELDVTSGQSDGFYELSAFGGYRVAGSEGSGVTLDGTLWRTDYDEVDPLDLDLASGGVEFYDRALGWRSGLRVGYEVTTLGSDSFLDTASLRLQSQRSTPSGRYRLRYRYEDIDAADAYAYLSGSRQRVELRGRFPWGAHRWGLEYIFEDNDRDDFATPTEFISYSPRRHELRLYADLRLPARWRSEFELGYRESRYADAEISAVANGLRREDERALAVLRLSRPVSRHLEFSAELRHTDNDSNIGDYAYTQTLTLLSLSALF
jgi:tetratricopeptide (TPR) repeat protein